MFHFVSTFPEQKTVHGLSLYILFAEEIRLGGIEGTLRSSSQAAICLPLKDGGIPLSALFLRHK